MKNQYSRVGGKMMQGAVAIELALLMIPLLVLAFGVAEFGRAIYQYNTLTKVVRDSVRVVSQHDPNDLVNYPLYEAEAKCLAVHGTIDCSGPVLLSGLNVGMVEIRSWTGAGGINLVEAKITGYTFNFTFNPLAWVGNRTTNIPFGDIHATMRQL